MSDESRPGLPGDAPTPPEPPFPGARRLPSQPVDPRVSDIYDLPYAKAPAEPAASEAPAAATQQPQVAAAAAGGPPVEAARQAPKRRGKPKRTRTVLRVVLVSMVVLALVTGLGVAYYYRDLNANINVNDVNDELGDDRPEKLYTGNGEPLNILVLGSDTREGDNKIDGEAGGGVSDTTILLHVSGDRTRAYGISIPRDSIVERPECGVDDEIPGSSEAMWNAAYAIGGTGCTIRQFEANTGIRVDHHVVVDFAGFKDMVDAVDGVPMCISEEIDDPEHNIFLKAGQQVLDGEESLAFVRVRYKVGDGSDIGRTVRQQEFIAALINKVVSAGTLTRIDRVIGFLDATTKSLEVDPGLGSLTKMGNLAMQVQDIGMDKIEFLTIPNAYFPRESEHWGRVFWTEDADKVWKRLAKDKPLSRKLSSGVISAANAPVDPSASASPDASETPSETPTDTPSETPSPSITTTTPSPSPSLSVKDQERADAARDERLSVGLCG